MKKHNFPPTPPVGNQEFLKMYLQMQQAQARYHEALEKFGEALKAKDWTLAKQLKEQMCKTHEEVFDLTFQVYMLEDNNGTAKV